MKTSDLKAMFWKECRENARWAVLSGLGLSLGLVYAAYHEVAARAAIQPDDGLRLGYVWENATLIFTLGTPLIGLLLGLLQILPELRRDQWAFLVHRPASRTALFFGKALPGVCLYLLATVPPLLILAAWDALPGRQAAPSDWRFTLGAWAAILAGLPFYFAGLVTALRPARWYGSRALPIFAALLSPLAASWLGEFWQVVLVCVLLTAALLLAAWGGFLTSGQYAGQPRLARFGLGASLFAGMAVALIGSFALSLTLYQSLFPAVRSDLSLTQYDVDTDGRILRDIYANGTVRYADLQGKPLPALEQRNRTGRGVQSLPFQSLPFTEILNPWTHSQRTEQRYSAPQRYVAPLQTFLYHFEDTAWFYLYDQDQAVGYSLRTHRVVSYLGPRGFADTSNDAGRFLEPLTSSLHHSNTRGLLQFPHSVFLFNPDQRTLTRLWTAAGGEQAQGSGFLTLIETSAVLQPVVVAADNQLHVFSGEGRPLFTTPRSLDAQPYSCVQAAISPRLDRFFFWCSVNGFGAQSWAASKIVTFSPSGRVLQAVTLPALQSPPPYQTPSAAALLVPPAADAAGLGVMLHDRWFGDTQQRKTRNPLVQDAGLRGLLLLSALMGLVSAVLAWLISRRLGDGRRGQIAWALGVFWLGGYGVLLLLALRAWPARVPCLNCGRQRVVENETCEHCGAAWARPKRDGTEIFDAEGREAEPAPLG